MQAVGLTWALLEGYQGESVLAEMVSEVALRRGRCWQTRSVVQAGMGWGALRRRLQAPQAQESGEALVWDPVLREAGPVGARWTQVGAVEWGCGGGRGCKLEEWYCEHPL